MLRLRRPLPDPACANFTRLLEEASTNAFEAMKFRALEAKPKSSTYYYNNYDIKFTERLCSLEMIHFLGDINKNIASQFSTSIAVLS